MKISVIMSSYNGSATVERAIKSILNQTFSDFEFLICDDASTDDTYKIILDLSKQDSRIKILKNNINIRLAASLNKCLSLTQGEFIARMDDDDVAHPNRFLEQVNWLEDHKEFAFCGTGAFYFDNDGIFGTASRPEIPTLFEVYKYSPFIHPSIMIRKNVLLEVGGYTVSNITRRCEDYDLWCKLYFMQYCGYNIQNNLIYYYESRDSMLKRKKINRYELFVVKSRWRKKLKLPWWYEIFALNDLIKILIPNQIILYHHRKHLTIK